MQVRVRAIVIGSVGFLHKLSIPKLRCRINPDCRFEEVGVAVEITISEQIQPMALRLMDQYGARVDIYFLAIRKQGFDRLMLIHVQEKFEFLRVVEDQYTPHLFVFLSLAEMLLLLIQG